MAHFAKIDDQNTVLEVVVINNDDVGNLPFPESEPVGIAFCKSLFGEDTNWLQTSYNGNFRKNFACVGGCYFADLDVFIHPQPYPSWTLNRQIGEWEAPVPMPPVSPNYIAIWDEEGQEWDVILDRANV